MAAQCNQAHSRTRGKQGPELSVTQEGLLETEVGTHTDNPPKGVSWGAWPPLRCRCSPTAPGGIATDQDGPIDHPDGQRR